jgi:hypothetical protein
MRTRLGAARLQAPPRVLARDLAIWAVLRSAGTDDALLFALARPDGSVF